MNYNKRIRQSRFGFKVKKIAADIFNKWMENAQSVYGLSPDAINTIGQEQVDEVFIEHLEKAIISLTEEESPEKTTIPGWGFGFLCGYVQGSIDVYWVNKYIIEPGREFEELLKLKSMILCLNFDDSTVNKIFLIYSHLLQDRIHVSDLVQNENSNIIPIKKFDNSSLIQRNAFKKEIIEILSNELTQKIMTLLENKKENCCPDITGYLDINDMIEIAGEEHFGRKLSID
jgi:hypothetical protein